MTGCCALLANMALGMHIAKYCCVVARGKCAIGSIVGCVHCALPSWKACLGFIEHTDSQHVDEQTHCLHLQSE